MNIKQSALLKGLSVSAIALAITACSTTETSSDISSASTSSSSEIAARESALKQRELELMKREAKLESQLSSHSSASFAGGQEPLLPPYAKPGECYARVFVPPTYVTEQETIKIKDETENVRLIPAEYRWVEKDILVQEASSKVEIIPAVFGQEKETILVKEARNIWRTDLRNDAPPASDKLLAAATSGGVDLDGAKAGMCFHEHYQPAEYRSVTQEILVSEATQVLSAVEAQYEWVEEQVLVQEASNRIEEVPAVFETVTEQILDVPAHTIWKKGTGPIQRIDEATGEIMCLVEVPATYKTITKRVLKAPATTRTVEIPAVYDTVKVKRKLADASQRVSEIPAEYKTVTSQELVSEERFIWHEIHDATLDKRTRTGSQICLLEEPAQYKTVARRVVQTPASTRTIEIPAVYNTVKVKELVSEAREERTTIPAEYKTVSHKKIAEDGHMEWRSILCETNMTRNRISAIQAALKEKGYNPGPIDGIIGKQTMQAVSEFQSDNKLPSDKYLNLTTLEALGISAQ